MKKWWLFGGVAGICITLFLTAFIDRPSHTLKLKQGKKAHFLSFESDTCTLLFGGDLMGHGPQIQAAFQPQTNTYQYHSVFTWLQPLHKSVDFSIANLEVTLAGPPYSGYPQFSSPDAYAVAIQQNGWDVLVTANNHSQDRGKKGLIRTLQVLDSLQILHTGTFKDTNQYHQQSPLILKKGSIRIAILNYTYGTNGLVVTPPTMVNMLDSQQIAFDFRKAQLAGADFIIPFVHWGDEYQRYPNTHQKKWADYLIEQGASAIIGAHPHVVQTFEWRKNPQDTSIKIPVFYSLGNLVSNQRERYKDGGIFAYLKLIKNATHNKVEQVAHLPFWVYKSPGPIMYEIIPVQAFEQNHSVFKLSKTDSLKLMQFSKDTRTLLSNLSEYNFYKDTVNWME